MADYVSMIPGGGWHAVLKLKDGGTRDTPLIGWALSENDVAMPFFYPAGEWAATELSTAMISANPEWGIASFWLYHPEGKTRDAPRLPESDALVVHLMTIDPDDLKWDDEIFTRCCGINWRMVSAAGMVTSRRDLVTCQGRPGPAAESP